MRDKTLTRLGLALLCFLLAYGLVWVDGGPEWASAGFGYLAWLVACSWKDD